jgi:hypothetical protein
MTLAAYLYTFHWSDGRVTSSIYEPSSVDNKLQAVNWMAERHGLHVEVKSVEPLMSLKDYPNTNLKPFGYVFSYYFKDDEAVRYITVKDKDKALEFQINELRSMAVLLDAHLVVSKPEPVVFLNKSLRTYTSTN